MFRETEKLGQEGQKQKRRLRIKKIGTYKKSVLFLWILLISSVAFGIYKNFTAVDVKHETVKEIVEEKLIDTNAIEEFVKDFARAYYSWSNTKAGVEQRTLEISRYMTEELQAINLETVTVDVQTNSEAEDVQIWKVEKKTEEEYKVLYSVAQRITELMGEGKNKEETEVTVERFYSTTVHVDADGNMIVIQNPVAAKSQEKSDYEAEKREPDGTVGSEDSEEITEFLNSFFTMYPTASEKDLAYYVRDNVLPSANGDYIFSELVNPVYVMDGNQVHAYVYVKYVDQWAKMNQIFQYDLVLEKEENWMVVASE